MAASEISPIMSLNASQNYSSDTSRAQSRIMQKKSMENTETVNN